MIGQRYLRRYCGHFDKRPRWWRWIGRRDWMGLDLWRSLNMVGPGKRGLVLYPDLPSSKFCVQFFTGGVAKIKNVEPQTTPLYSTLCFINIQIRKCSVAQIDPIHHNSRVGVNSFVSAFFASFHSSSFCLSNGHQTCNPRMHKKLFACSVSKQPLCRPPLWPLSPSIQILHRIVWCMHTF